MAEPAQRPCDLCLGVIRYITDYSGPGGETQKLEWHPDIDQLQNSARSCPLCSSIWDLSLSSRLSMATEKLAGSTLRSSPQLLLEVVNAKKTGGVYWAVLHTAMNVKQLGLEYTCVDTIGISSRPACEDHEHPKFWRFGKDEEGRSLSEDRIATIRQWLQECESNHEACNPSPTHYLKSLIDVGPHGPLRLVSRDEIQEDKNPIRYATLSHSWGEFVPMQTTLKTKSLFEERISEESLPRTFRDAVNIARSLGISYLWIDSLCIIQDDPQDWKREALQMEDIYLGSTINIAASDALDSTEGCFPEEAETRDPTIEAFDSDNRATDFDDRVTDAGPAYADKVPRVFVYEQRDQPHDQTRSTMIRFQARTPRMHWDGALSICLF
ncbi:hypothetical protein FDECE_18219, partial [Fusarium decemcellulare]